MKYLLFLALGGCAADPAYKQEDSVICAYSTWDGDLSAMWVQCAGQFKGKTIPPLKPHNATTLREM